MMAGITQAAYLHPRPHEREEPGMLKREDPLAVSGAPFPPVSSFSMHRIPSPPSIGGPPPLAKPPLSHSTSNSGSDHTTSSPTFKSALPIPEPRDSISGASPHRQSLPSIHEVVRVAPLSHPPSATLPPPAPSSSYRNASPPRSPRYLPPTLSQDGPPRRPLSPNGHYSLSQPAAGGPARNVNGVDSNPRLAALHPINTVQPARDSTHHAYGSPSYGYQPHTQPYTHRRSDGEPVSAFAYGSQSQNGPISAPVGSVVTAFPVSSSISDPGRHAAAWRSNDPADAHGPGDRSRMYGGSYSDTIRGELNRQLTSSSEMIETERILGNLADTCGTITEWAKHYAPLLHDALRRDSAHIELPAVRDIEDLQRMAADVPLMLQRIRENVIVQNNLVAERSREQDERKRALPPNGNDHDSSRDHRGGGDGSGPDTKKRRSRAAPPGRCHSCNRNETPEWRRGPDGARTLCNACGLHYAKFTRKMATSNKTANGTSTAVKTKEDNSP